MPTIFDFSESAKPWGRMYRLCDICREELPGGAFDLAKPHESEGRFGYFPTKGTPEFIGETNDHSDLKFYHGACFLPVDRAWRAKHRIQR